MMDGSDLLYLVLFHQWVVVYRKLNHEIYCINSHVLGKVADIFRKLSVCHIRNNNIYLQVLCCL